MEKKLASMFEYQRFAKNPRLAKLIAETENRTSARALDDDDLWLVNAAGVPESFLPDEEKSKPEKW